MELVLRTLGADAEVDVHPDPRQCDDRPLAELIGRGTGRPAPATVTVDGRVLATSTPMAASGLRRGSVVDLRPPPAPEPAVAEIVTRAGPGTGRRAPLAAGRYRIGTGPAAHELAAGTVDVGLLDLRVPDRAALVIDRRVELAGRIVDIGAARPAPRPAAASTAAFNRPPRANPPAASPAIDVPDAAPADGEGRGFPLLALLAPIPLGIAMAVIVGQPRFLLFCLLSPVMGVANWVEEQRRRRQRRTRGHRADEAARARLGERLAARHAEETARRRADHPDVAELVDWLRSAGPRLWERRHGDPDAWQIPIGLADDSWQPDLTRGSLDGVDELVAALGPLPLVPVVAPLAGAAGLGLVGTASDVDAVARAVVLAAAALHGPADLAVLVVGEQARVASWEWVKWLPHALDGTGLLVDRQQVRDAVGALVGASASRRTLVVATASDWWHDHDAPLRPLLAHADRAPLVALSDRAHLLPATTTTVATVPLGGGPGRIEHLGSRRRRERVVLAQVDADVAVDAARAVAHLTDPEQLEGSHAVPTHVGVLSALGLPEADAASVAARWRRPDRGVRTPIGIGREGPVVVDLVTDGPHGLVAGTTGAGKSELLRTLVVGLATALPPDELNVVLVDFKGGAAFDKCADLPHTVGLVTDLDEHLAARVLRCLRAELTRRERRLRDLGASSIEQAPTVLARLLLVVDEFALLAAQLPAFVPGLIDIAQRGRSLGIHLVLATQRPAGVVDHKIKANTNLRIALRVQDDADSLDVVDTAAAASISRRVPGRAVARFGAGELVELQTALSTGCTVGADPGLRVHPAVAVRAPTALERRLPGPADAAPAPGAPTDLERLVAAVTEAARGRPPPARPYLDPLPARLDPDELAPASLGGVPFGLADLPDEQRQATRAWPVGASMVVYGMAGSGTSSTLATLVLGAARQHGPDELHVYVVDADAGRLAPLAGLAHVGAYVRLDETERLVRLAHWLHHEIERRRVRAAAGSPGPAPPAVVVVIDNVGSLRQAVEQDRRLDDVGAALERVARDGTAVGVTVLMSATHERAVPLATSAQIARRLVMGLADPAAYVAFGFRPADVPDMVPGRALDPSDRAELQVAAPPPDLAAAVAALDGAWPRPERPAARVDPIPTEVAVTALLGRAVRRADGWSVPVGLDRRRAAPAVVHLRVGSTFAVTGPPGSGRTSSLVALAQAVRAADADTVCYAVAPDARPLAPFADVPARATDVNAWVERVLADERRRLVLVDDADALGGPSFERLARAGDRTITWIVSGPADALRAPGQWCRPLLRTRQGLLLAAVPTDGDLLRVLLPPRLGPLPRGTGLLVIDGEVAPVVCARPAAEGDGVTR